MPKHRIPPTGGRRGPVRHAVATALLQIDVTVGQGHDGRVYEHRTSTPLSYDTFKQRVRRFPRSLLLRRLAETSAVLERSRLLSDPRPASQDVTEFTVAGVALTSLVAGNEYRSAPVTQEVVKQLCHDFIEVDDPDVGKGSLSQILTRSRSNNSPSSTPKWKTSPGPSRC